MTIPETMTALVCLEDGFSPPSERQQLDSLDPFVELAEVPVPQPAAGQALVKVARAAVNPSDIAFVQGIYGQPRRKGIAAGFEATGTVVAGDTPLLGQRVSFVGTGSGTWAEYALADSAKLIPLRPDVSDDDAAGLIVNPLTALAMFDIVRQDGAGSFLATAGGSQLGKFLIALGKEHGIPCLPVVRRVEQASALRELGAADVLVSTEPGFAAQMTAALERHAPRVLLDAVGGQVSADLFDGMGQGACWIVYGRMDVEPPRLNQVQDFIFRNKRIEGFWLARWMQVAAPDRVAAVVAECQAHFADGRWSTAVNAVVPLAEAAARLPEAYARPDGKVLIAPGT